MLEKMYYLFRVMIQEEQNNYIVEYLIQFKEHDFLQEFYGEMEDDLFTMFDSRTYVLDASSLEKVSKMMNYNLVDFVTKIFKSCITVECHFCDQIDVVTMRSTIQGVCDQAQKDEHLSNFFKRDFKKLQEVYDHMNSIWNESILNAMFLKKYQIDMTSLMEFEGKHAREYGLKIRKIRRES